MTENNPIARQPISQSGRAATKIRDTLYRNFEPSYKNNILIAADPIFSSHASLHSDLKETDPIELRKKLSRQIDEFKNTIANQGYYHETVLMGAFALSAFLDETLSNSAWGRKVNWPKHALTHDIDSRLNANKYFFDMLEHAAQKPSVYIDIIELMHVCLSLGYKGKFQKASSRKELSKIKETTYQLIKLQRKDYTNRLSNIVIKNSPCGNFNSARFSFWKLFSITALSIVLISTGVILAVNMQEKNLKGQLTNLVQ